MRILTATEASRIEQLSEVLSHFAPAPVIGVAAYAIAATAGVHGLDLSATAAVLTIAVAGALAVQLRSFPKRWDSPLAVAARRASADRLQTANAAI